MEQEGTVRRGLVGDELTDPAALGALHVRRNERQAGSREVDPG
ncbi:MAG: hypothetical protein ACPHIC_00480 [Acidimicrobiales bacterium]